MRFDELNTFAYRISAEKESDHSEAELRRSVSALYYGLFHALTEAGASWFAFTRDDLRTLVARAYAHRTMKDVCTLLAKPHTGPMRRPYDALFPNPPTPKLRKLAQAFIRLQEEREKADYDLNVRYERQEALELLQLSAQAHQHLLDLRSTSEAPAFLMALLLHDRWKRRG